MVYLTSSQLELAPAFPWPWRICGTDKLSIMNVIFLYKLNHLHYSRVSYRFEWNDHSPRALANDEAPGFRFLDHPLKTKPQFSNHTAGCSPGSWSPHQPSKGGLWVIQPLCSLTDATLARLQTGCLSQRGAGRLRGTRRNPEREGICLPTDICKVNQNHIYFISNNHDWLW